MTAFFAAMPILAVLGLMLGLGWTAARAGLVGLLLAMGVALVLFDLTQGSGREVPALLGVFAEASFTTATILWIVFPALAIHALQTRVGAIGAIRQALAGVSDDRVIAILLIGWFFALFMEGAAGFGVPVALAAPLLVGLGLAPERALAAALIGHAAGATFGAVGTPIVPLISASGMDGAALAIWPAILHGMLGWILAVAFLLTIGARPGVALGLGTAASAAYFIPFAAIAILVGPELPTLLGALLGGLAFVLVARRRKAAVESLTLRASGNMSLLRAGAPYLILIALVGLTRLTPPLAEALRDLALDWTWQMRFSGSFAPFYHPGTMLALAFTLGALIQRADLKDVTGALLDAVKRLVPVTLALLAMLALARVLVHAGMVDALAQTAADATGGAWPLAAPFVGVLGTFVTGSATASNILFAELQLSVASEIGLSVLAIIGAQAFGAAVGNIVSPLNIVAGAATVGAIGREGAVLRRTLPAALLYAAAGGALLWILLWVR